ncbi:MAG: hypothetical protein V3T72_08795 [Thermoanaerobaculia bacterium]
MYFADILLMGYQPSKRLGYQGIGIDAVTETNSDSPQQSRLAGSVLTDDQQALARTPLRIAEIDLELAKTANVPQPKTSNESFLGVHSGSS